ncbi:Heat shock protein ssb1, partial [Coemansia sp. RSA 1694]
LEVTFDIDANGILKVTSVDKASGRKANITISNATGHLSAADIERMVNDAEKFKEEDKGREDAIQAKNNLEASIHQIESTISDIKVDARLKPKAREELNNALAEAMEFLDASATTADKSAINTVQRKLELVFKRSFQVPTKGRR